MAGGVMGSRGLSLAGNRSRLLRGGFFLPGMRTAIERVASMEQALAR